MFQWTLVAVALLVSCHYGAGSAPCDNMYNYFSSYSNCSMGLYGSMSDTKDAMKAYLRDMCTTRIGSYVSCMTTQYSACPADVKDTVVNNANSYKNRVCDGTQLKPTLDSLVNPMADLMMMDMNSTTQSCIQSHDAQLMTEMQFCFSNQAINQQDSYIINNKTIPLGLKHVSNYYRRVLICYRRVLRAHSTCSEEHLKALLAYYMMILPMANIKAQDLQAKSNAKPREGKRVTLAAYGDPHLVVYKSTSLTTCSAPGRQVYLENDFIIITANNTAVAPQSKATTITNLEIQVMDKNGKVKAKYTAGNSLLPDSFEGGKDKMKIDDLDAEVTTLNRLIRIKIRSAGVVVILSKYRHMYPVLLVRGSESVFDSSSGLLVDGCVDEIPRTVARRKRATSACETACNAQTSQRKEACLFDCTETNDPTFAKQAGEDIGSAEKEAEQVDYEMADDIQQNAAMTITLSLTCTVMLIASFFTVY